MKILAKDLTQEQRKEFFEAFCEIADFYIDKDEEGFPFAICFPWNYPEQELHGETIKEMANNYLIELLEREEEEEEIALKILDSEFDK
jgi:hypothetical protein